MKRKRIVVVVPSYNNARTVVDVLRSSSITQAI